MFSLYIVGSDVSELHEIVHLSIHMSCTALPVTLMCIKPIKESRHYHKNRNYSRLTYKMDMLLRASDSFPDPEL
jgi:hypothetical protein